MLNQLQHCEDNGIPFAIILGESELQRNSVKLRDVTSRQETEVLVAEMVDTIKQRMKEKETMPNGQ